MLLDEDDYVYKVGLKMDYVPKKMNFFNDFPKEDITLMACGRKHYIIINKNNNLMVWGNVYKEKCVKESEGFGLYFGNDLFDNGNIKYLSMKYGIFGALVEHK